MIKKEIDLSLRRIERNMLVVCLLFSVAAKVLSSGFSAPLGVLSGGVLIALSYWAIKKGSSFLASTFGPVSESSSEDGASRKRRRKIFVRVVLQFMGRYALLAFMAYVMIVHLRFHPVALLVGVSSVVIAVALEATWLMLSSWPFRYR